MQAKEYVWSEGISILMQQRIERELMRLANKSDDKVSRLYDCHEFGFCLLNWSHDGWRTEWFHEKPGRKTSKPRIVVTVTGTDYDRDENTGHRERWYFALSKLGYLYCVAYESYHKARGQWVLRSWYRVWSKPKYPKKANIAIPEDWVFREAERLWKLKGKKRG